MTNRVTAAERDRIQGRANELLREALDAVQISKLLQAEFGISRPRARSHAARAIRLARGHGGARPGAGRPSEYPDLVRKTVTLPAAMVDRLTALGGGNLSAGIRKLAGEQTQKRPGQFSPGRF